MSMTSKQLDIFKRMKKEFDVSDKLPSADIYLLISWIEYLKTHNHYLEQQARRLKGLFTNIDRDIRAEMLI